MTIYLHKARLVAQGFSKTYMIDCNETISLVVRLNLACIIISLAVNQEWSLHQLDVSNAFLYNDLTARAFMEQPLGYRVQAKTTQVCHLHRAIYGLK